MKVLIVEDDEDSRILLEFALEQNKFNVFSAENGKIALELARNNLPDIIISDILMPEMDGYKLCKAIRSDENLCNIPFIFYTATYTEIEDKQLALDLGATKFLVKPMEIDLLLTEIKAVLNNYKNKNSNLKANFEEQETVLTNDYANVMAKKLNKKVCELEKERERLSKSESKYRRLVEALRDNYFFYTHNSDKFFNYVSPSIKNVLGYSAEDFQINFQKYLTDDKMNSSFITKINNGPKGIGQDQYEIEIFHKNGNIKRLFISDQPILDKNGIFISVEGIAQDITKRIIAEKELARTRERLQQAQKMEAIGSLAGGIAHDFNNLLTPIMGYIDMIKAKSPKESNVWRWSQTIQNAAFRARELVKQILAFSRCNEQEKSRVIIQRIIKEVLQFLRSSIPQTIEIKQSMNQKYSLISANPIQMHQVIMNLCTNAYYAMREKGGVLTVSLSEIEVCSDNKFSFPDFKIGKYIRIEISDTGTGIKKNHIKKIFDPYFTTKPKNEGTGLGLSVVHGIIKDHCGHIKVFSEFGKGTTFLVYLPVIQIPQKKSDIKRIKEELNGTERILLIDDETIIVELLTRQLNSFGYKVTASNSPVEAIEIFSQNPHGFDLIITDMSMPKKDGVKLSQETLSIRPDMPIVLCTGYNELVNKDLAIDIGIKAFIMKPMSKNEIGKIVRNVLDQSKESSSNK